MAAVAAAAISAYGAHEGQRKEERGIKKAEQQQAAIRKREEEIYGETAAFRELAREAVPFIREDVLAAEPGTSSLYQRALTGGIEDIQTQLAGYGLADSSVAGKAIGEFTGELSARDISDIRSKRLALASGGTIGIPETLSAAGMSAGVASNLSNLATQRGVSQGGLYGNLANITSAGIGAYQQQQGYQQQLDEQTPYDTQTGGSSGPYLTDQPSLTIDPKYR